MSFICQHDASSEEGEHNRHVRFTHRADCAEFEAALGFRRAIVNADVAPKAIVTSADVIQGLSKFKGETLGGYAPPLTYGDGTAPNPQEKCVYLYKWKGTKFIPLEGATKYTCQP